MNKPFLRIIILLFTALFYLGCQGGIFNANNNGSTNGIIEKSGELTQDEVWDGRIYITGSVIVPADITLTIRSGTIVGFEPKDEPSEIIVYGEFYAEGSPDNMIVFGSLGKQQTPQDVRTEETPTTNINIQNSFNNNIQNSQTSTTRKSIASPPKAGDWRGITIETQSLNSRLTYCRIQHAKNAILCKTDTVQIERCLFSENNIGVLCENTNPTISSNEFNRNGSGAQFRGSSAPEVEFNEFAANRYGIVCEDDSRPRIHHNNIRSNYEYAIICYSTSSPEIVSNNITLNNGWAVYDGGRLRDNYISGNKQVGPNVTELGIGTQSDQFYSVEEVFDPRSTPVSEAGLPRDKF
ncbi:right-handed parallel beta-helix repeat-containing protein [Candidatus Poribacteria bacterium]|nr:right-handed parallel beta-helix repeat-containing protein [Candidatus Poribacteria bacterium]